MDKVKNSVLRAPPPLVSTENIRPTNGLVGSTYDPGQYIGKTSITKPVTPMDGLAGYGEGKVIPNYLQPVDIAAGNGGMYSGLALRDSAPLTSADLEAFKPGSVNSANLGGVNYQGNPDTGWMSSEGLKTGAAGVQALSGLANAYLGYKNYKLAKDSFGFEKAATNANYINQAKDYNTQLQNGQNVGLALGGGAMSPDQVAASNAYINSRRVSENAIG